METRGDTGATALRAGFGLLEVVVALLLLTVALAGVLGSLGYGALVAGSARRTRQARQLAVDAARDRALAPHAEITVSSNGPDDCARQVVEVPAPAATDAARWLRIEVVCTPAGAPAADGWRPGRVALLVAR